MTRTTLGLCTTVLALSGFAYACGSASLSAFDSNRGDPPSAGGGADAGALGSAAPGADGKELTPVDNAVILVHAAKSQAFRLCFDNERKRLPQPDSQTMPEANVVGVEVGSAVRLGPLAGPPGKIYLFEEALIRAFYPAFGGTGTSQSGPDCDGLLASPSLSALAIAVGSIDTDLSRGVHLLVVKGCPKDTPGRQFSLAECGAGWTSAAGNLAVTEITLTGANRPESATLPAQVVNLSQPVDTARAGRDLVVSFGDLAAKDAVHTPVATNPALFGQAEPSVPARLPYSSSDLAIYDSVGFRIRFASPDGGGGGDQDVLDLSLAKIQKASSPRDVPPTYYAAASNYALLLLGDPNAKLPDGGADGDPRRNVHLLAVPVIEPKNDAGTGGGDLDGGSASSP